MRVSKASSRWIAGGALALLLAGGCATYDPAAVRRDQTHAFTNALAVLQAEALTHPLALEDCLRLAMTNHYEARRADLDRELARIGKNAAFTAFLPTVALSAGYTSYAKQSNVMTQRRFSSVDLELGLPLFMPSTWFLYAAARQGHAVAETAARYVRQGIVLEVSTRYYQVRILEETVAALETQLEAARETADRVAGLAEEGLARAWEAEQAKLQSESLAAALDQAGRQRTVTRGELLVGMGLSPLAPLVLSGETRPAAAPAGDTAQRVLYALEIHPALAMADRQVVIQNHQVRQAFCAFLPSLSLFSTGSWTGNDLADHAANWLTGLRGVWTLFDGLANVARYRAAKVERRQSELERESAFLQIMIQVIAADAALRDAAAEALLRQRAYNVAAAKFAEYDARSREGLLPLSEALEARAAMDQAQVELLRSRYAERIGIANLELAMGLTALPE